MYETLKLDYISLLKMFQLIQNYLCFWSSMSFFSLLVFFFVIEAFLVGAENKKVTDKIIMCEQLIINKNWTKLAIIL